MVKRVMISALLILSIVLVGCSFQSKLNIEKPKLETKELSVEQIKADLIGHNLTWNGQLVWQFAALSEYEQFDIKGKQTQGNAIEYDVSMKLKDFASSNHYLVEAFIVYREIDGKWELISVVTKLLEHIHIDTERTY
ncbi:hypothetical protein ACFLUR_01215 [Chloroflexota bacterium]